MMSSSAPPPPPPAGDAPTRHVPHIDGLRAVAVLAVIVCHLREAWLPGGFVGVDVFFVISGFVVSQSVSRWDRGGLGAFLAYFYARRMQRILPALLVCLTLSMMATTLLIPPVWLGLALERAGLYAFFGLSNFYLSWNRENYFSPTLDYNPFMHTWSLGVEEQFYLLFPLLFFAWTRGGRWRTCAVIAAAAALLGSYAWATYIAHRDTIAAFYLIGSRLWELAAGVVLFQCTDRHLRTPGPMRRLIAWVGAVLLAYTLVKARVGAYPAPHPLLSVVATCALIAGLHHTSGTSALVRLLASRPMTWIGRTSYSLYLWHWPVFVLMRWTCGLESAAQMLAGVAATFLLATLSSRYVEQPIRYSRTLARWPRFAIIALSVVTVIAGWSFATLIATARPRISLSTVTHNPQDWHSSPDITIPERPGCVLAAATVTTGDVKPVQVMTYSRTGCTDAAQKPPRILVLGDSHASALTKLLTHHVLTGGGDVVVYQNYACTFANLQPEQAASGCAQGNQAALNHMLEHTLPGDVLLLASLRTSRLTNQFAFTDQAQAWDAMTSASAWRSRQQAVDQLIAKLMPLATRGIRIVLTAPTPVLRATPYRCADWFNAGNPICAPGLFIPKDEMLRFRKQAMDSLRMILTRLPSTYVWDPLPILCPETACQAYREGHPLYVDGDHLSGYANTLLLPYFERFLASLPAPDSPAGDTIMQNKD